MTAFEQYQHNRELHIKELKSSFKVVEPQQFTLAFKDSLSVILTEMDEEKYYFVRDNSGKFGFSELMVNQLMEFMYNKGKEHGISEGKTIGWDDAMNDVADKLGFDNQ